MKPIGTYFLAAIISPLVALVISGAVFLYNYFKSDDSGDELFNKCLLFFAVIILLLNTIIVALAHRDRSLKQKLVIWAICLLASFIGILFDYAVIWTINLF